MAKPNTQAAPVKNDALQVAAVQNAALQGTPLQPIPESVPEIDFDARMREANAAFAKVQSLKDSDFEEEARDFWKPTEVGESVTGVYLGREKQARYFVHSLAVPHPKTQKPMQLRVNGSRILSKELAKGAEGQGVKIVFKGQSVTGSGQKLNLFQVLWAKR